MSHKFVLIYFFVPDLVDKVRDLIAHLYEPRIESLSSNLVRFCQCLVNQYLVGEKFCVNLCYPVRRRAAAPDFLAESARRLLWASLKCPHTSEDPRGPLASFAAAVPLEVITNSLLSQKLVCRPQIYVSR